MRAKHFAKRVYKIPGPLERDDSTGRPDDVRKIDSCVPGTRADIQNAFASGDTSPFPAIEHNPTPRVVLHAESGNFFLARTENVIALRCHQVTVADCEEITTLLLRASSSHWCFSGNRRPLRCDTDCHGSRNSSARG